MLIYEPRTVTDYSFCFFSTLRTRARSTMASLKEESVLEEELTCPVCLEVFRDPHLLPCGHNLCLPCLKRLRKQAMRGRLRCPECRESHRANASLQKNFRLANIAEDYRKRGQLPREGPPAPVHCDYCVGEQAAAVKTCLKCEVSMCSEHVRPHLELPAFLEHLLAEPVADMRKRKCPEHDELYKYYCMDESVCVCNACTVEGVHAGHTVKTLKNTMKDLKQGAVQIQIQKVKRKITKVEKLLQVHTDDERESQKFVDEADDRLIALGESVRVQLDVFLTALKDCVRTHSGATGPEVQQNLSRINLDRERLQEVHSGLQTLLTQNDPFCFLQDYNSTEKKLRRLLKKPLYSPEYVALDTEGMAESMEAKLEEFQEELRERVMGLVESVCVEPEGVGEEEEGENNSEEETDEEEEEVMSEEEEADESSESGEDSYIPNDEEEEEEEEEEGRETLSSD